MCLQKPMEIVGYGFRPTDEELVHFYLKHKLLDDDPRVHVMTDIDLCDVEPWEVPEMLAKSVIPFKNSEWFFFRRVQLKYSNSERFNRTTKSGFWKPTGKPRDVRTGDTNTVIGTKKTLVFHSGRASKGVNSNWVIHEYHALNSLQSQNAFVLCRLKKKHGKTTEGGTAALICDEEESSRSVVSDNENQAIAEGVPSGDTFSRMETICQLTYQAENNISPAEQSLIDIEQDEASFPNPSNDAYFRKENNNRHIPYAQTLFEAMHTSLGSTQNPFEVGSILTLFETTQPSFETTNAPFETMETPFDTMETPLGAMYTSFETTQTSLGSMLTPLETTQPSFETIKTPSETMEIPSDTMETLSGTMQFPLGAMQSPLGAMYTSSETTQTSLGFMLTPLETTLLSFETIKTPFETMETPFDTLETLSGTMQSPLGTMQSPLGAMHTSFETTQTSLGSITPFETTHPSFETTNTPFETMETPFDTRETPLGAMYTSFETTQTSLGSMLTPFETTQTSFETSKSLETPFETIETPLGAMYTPPEMIHPPSETTQNPLGSMQTSLGSTHIPLGSMQIPLASRKIPFESRKIPFQNTHTPSQTPFEFPKSLKRAYCESTCINPEVVLKLDACIDDSSTMCTKYLNSDEYHSSKMFKTSYDVVNGDTHLLFSNQEASQKQESIFQDNLRGVDTSSCDSTVYNPEEINWNEISSFPCT